MSVTVLNSASLSGLSSAQVAKFSSTCSGVLMPESTIVHARHALQKAEGPGDGALLRPQGLERLHGLRRQVDQPPAADALHHPDGDAALVEQRHLLVGVLEAPVNIVELYLAELQLVPAGVEEAPERGQLAVAGKAQVADAPGALLLQQVVKTPYCGSRHMSMFFS